VHLYFLTNELLYLIASFLVFRLNFNEIATANAPVVDIIEIKAGSKSPNPRCHKNI